MYKHIYIDINNMAWFLIAHSFCCNSNRFEPPCQGATPPAAGIRWRLASGSLADRLSSSSTGRRRLLTFFSQITKPPSLSKMNQHDVDWSQNVYVSTRSTDLIATEWGKSPKPLSFSRKPFKD